MQPLLFLAGCHGSSPSAAATAAAATAAGPSMESRLDAAQKCRDDAFRQNGSPPGTTYPNLLLQKGFMSDMLADARSFDANNLASLQAAIPPDNDLVRTQLAFTVFEDGADVQTYTADQRVKAKAYLGYYESKVFPPGTCPLDADILQLINKTGP